MLDEFDSFFVGDGSVSLLHKYNKEVSTCVGEFSQESIKLNLIDDYEEYIQDACKVIEEEVVNIYKRTKRNIFRTFDYLKIKSQKFEGVVKVDDMLIDGSDLYMIEYLKGFEDGCLVESIASLSAYRELGFTSVQFKSLEENCPLCKSFDGLVYDLDQLGDKLFGGLLHKYCKCDFIPVDKNSDRVVVETRKDMVYNNIEIKNMPIAFSKYLLKVFDKFVGIADVIEFGESFPVSGETMSKKVVVRSEDQGRNFVYSFSSYLGFYNTVSYLDSYLIKHYSEYKDLLDQVGFVDYDTYQGDIFMWRGQEVIEISAGDFVYFDTRERCAELNDIYKDLDFSLNDQNLQDKE